jgi:NAD(P)-dependent dehydrogenase (short-subunit alcohol dehydrogenase family)
MKSQSIREVKKGRPGERGVIVNIASTAGGVAVRNNSSYTSSKHAVIGLTKSAGTASYIVIFKARLMLFSDRPWDG